MSNRIKVTERHIEGLSRVRDYLPVSNTLVRELSKLGWVDYRRPTKVYDATGTRNIIHPRITAAGLAALQAAETPR